MAIVGISFSGQLVVNDETALLRAGSHGTLAECAHYASQFGYYWLFNASLK
jgi:hypothetical protein